MLKQDAELSAVLEASVEADNTPVSCQVIVRTDRDMDFGFVELAFSQILPWAKLLQHKGVKT